MTIIEVERPESTCGCRCHRGGRCVKFSTCGCDCHTQNQLTGEEIALDLKHWRPVAAWIGQVPELALDSEP